MYTKAQIVKMLTDVLNYLANKQKIGSIKFYGEEVYVHIYFNERRYECMFTLQDLYSPEDEELNILIKINQLIKKEV